MFSFAMAFNHPGLLHSKESIQRMRTLRAEENAGVQVLPATTQGSALCSSTKALRWMPLRLSLHQSSSS